MELQTILAIAIPVIGFLAFLSGYFYGKADGIKKCRGDRYASNDSIYQTGFDSGRIYTAEYLGLWAEELKKKYQNSRSEMICEDFKNEAINKK